MSDWYKVCVLEQELTLKIDAISKDAYWTDYHFTLPLGCGLTAETLVFSESVTGFRKACLWRGARSVSVDRSVSVEASFYKLNQQPETPYTFESDSMEGQTEAA